MKRKAIDLALHYGEMPRWLFRRMTELAREITIVIVDQAGHEAFLEKLSDPLWFQAFGCVLGFDWHSSGLTTTVCGALKTALSTVEKDIGIYVCGGKGAVSRKTPHEIDDYCQKLGTDGQRLIYSSRMSAKVDSAAIQNGYQLYHHTFIFTKDKNWCVIQQGMNIKTRYARRYHWLSEAFDNFVCEPHSAICCDTRTKGLNMVAKESGVSREVSAKLACDPVEVLDVVAKLPHRHEVTVADINPKRFEKVLSRTKDLQPANFEKLLAIQGVGPKTVRALSLVGELIYGAKPSFKDPARFSFAHGGKDGTPYPVDLKTYDESIQFLKDAVNKAKIGRTEKIRALELLSDRF